MVKAQGFGEQLTLLILQILIDNSVFTWHIISFQGWKAIPTSAEHTQPQREE
jgi:hypothetical protein